eukprot:9983281-Alexandrium_andersonii.AAC.1
MLAWESTSARGIRHTPAHTVRAPRPKRDVRALVPLSLVVGGSSQIPSHARLTTLFDRVWTPVG